MDTKVAPTESTTALILTGEGYGLSIAPDAEAQKAELLKHSALIIEVKDDASADAARNQLRKLGAMRILTEKSRTEIKAPVLKIGKDIDAMAATFVGDISAEEKRLSKLISGHAVEIERQRREAEAARLQKEREAEELRLRQERERQAEEERARQIEAEAERQRIEAENAMWSAETPAQAEAARLKEAEAKRLADEAAEQKRLADEAEAKRQQDTLDARSSILGLGLMSKAAAPAGVTWTLDFTVTDIHALYAHNPSLVDLTPKRSAILERLKQMQVGHTVPTHPGLTVTKEPKVRGR